MSMRSQRLLSVTKLFVLLSVLFRVSTVLHTVICYGKVRVTSVTSLLSLPSHQWRRIRQQSSSFIKLERHRQSSY